MSENTHVGWKEIAIIVMWVHLPAGVLLFCLFVGLFGDDDGGDGAQAQQPGLPC